MRLFDIIETDQGSLSFTAWYIKSWKLLFPFVFFKNLFSGGRVYLAPITSCWLGAGWHVFLKVSYASGGSNTFQRLNDILQRISSQHGPLSLVATQVRIAKDWKSSGSSHRYLHWCSSKIFTSSPCKFRFSVCKGRKFPLKKMSMACLSWIWDCYWVTLDFSCQWMKRQ